MSKKGTAKKKTTTASAPEGKGSPTDPRVLATQGKSAKKDNGQQLSANQKAESPAAEDKRQKRDTVEVSSRSCNYIVRAVGPDMKSGDSVPVKKLQVTSSLTAIQTPTPIPAFLVSRWWA